MGKKTDLRVLRTKKLIKDAFLVLILKKGFDAITIQDIADEAFINRATFYLHYQDKYDLLDQICDSYLMELIDVIKNPFHLEKEELDAKRIELTIRNVFANVEKNLDFYIVMLGPNGLPDFANRAEMYLFDKFKANFITVVGDLNTLEIPADFLLKFISSSYIGVMKWWLSTEDRQTPENLAKDLTKIMTKGPLNMMGYRIV